MLRTALHLTLTPLVFLFLALIVANRMSSGIGALIVMAGAAALGVVYGWRNRHR
jgi:positive regulator of sigma E activity